EIVLQHNFNNVKKTPRARIAVKFRNDAVNDQHSSFGSLKTEKITSGRLLPQLFFELPFSYLVFQFFKHSVAVMGKATKPFGDTNNPNSISDFKIHFKS